MDDRVAILDTVTRYATALDSRDWDLLDRVFTPDVAADFGMGPRNGLETVRKTVIGALGGAGPTQHLLGNHRVEIDGDSARCVCLVRAYHGGERGTYELFGEYRDRLVRTPAGWRIAERQLVVHHEVGSRDVLGS